MRRNYPPQYWGGKKLFHKIARLLMPMLFFGIGFTFTLSGPSAESVLGFLAAPAKNGYWYLMSLSVFYVALFPFRLTARKKWIADVAMAVAVWIVFYASWKCFAQEKDYLCLLDCGNHWPFFILGVFTTKYKLIDKAAAHPWVYSAALIGSALFLGLNFSQAVPIHAFDSLNRHIFMPLAIVTALSLLFVARHGQTTWIENKMEYIGRHTLDIYVIHYFIVSNVQLSMVDQWLEGTGNEILSACLSALLAMAVTVLSIAIGHILHRANWIERVVYAK